MRLNFRQGIVSHQTGGFLLLNTGNVDLLANNRSVTLTVADRASNYTHSEDNTILSAWTGPFAPATDYWLYWDFDTLNFTRTFGVTTLEPISQPTTPPSPALGQIWYDTLNNEHFEFTGAGYVKVFRVFAARYNSGTFFSESQDAPLFTGTQIGNTSSVRSGRILFTEFGDTLRRDDGTFFTAEDQFFTNQSQIAAIRLEANVSRAKCAGPALAAFQIVQWSSEGEITSATYNSTGTTVIGVLMEDLITNQVGSVLVQGTVTNPAWDYSTLPVGTHMYVDNGALTNVDPHVTDAITYPVAQVPVARLLDRDTVIFEQGLGGVGPVGPAGDIDNLPPATVSELGAIALSVPSSTPTFPVVVGDNDPRLAGGPFASAGHTHIGTEVSYIPTGGLVATNTQDAITELETEKVAIAGDTMTGFLTLNADPTAALHAATKEYVDGLVSGLVWQDPVCLVDLIDDSLATPPGSPVNGEAYIIPAGGGTGLWSAFAVNSIVQWHDSDSSWHDHGLVQAQSSRRFIISGKSALPGAGSFVGQDNNIAVYDAGGALTGFDVPAINWAVFVCPDDGIEAFNQYVFNGTDWLQFSGGSVGADDVTTVISGGVISTKDYADGGQVDAATYRGVDADTLYSQLGHGHAGSAITLTAPYIGADFGTPATLNDDRLVAGTVDLAVQELFDKKAAKEPSYADNTNLPTASSVAGMIAEVLAGGTDPGLFVSRGGSWVKIAVNDGTVQAHDHTLPYDISFFVAGPAASTADAVIGSFLVPRNMSMIINGTLAIRGYAETASAANVIFDIQKNGVSFGTLTFTTGTNAVSDNFPGATQTFVPGDRITLVAPAISESVISDVSVTIIACASMGVCPVTAI